MSVKKRFEAWLPRIVGTYLNALALAAPRYSGQKAIVVFSTPRSGRLRPKDVQYLSAFEQETLYIDGLPIQCYKKGHGGPVLLFVHGWESNAARWQHLMRAFEAAGPCTLITMDGPAHGASGSKRFNSLLYGQWIAEVCRHYKPTVLIGHSIGAASIVYYLTHLPATPVQQLVLMGAPSDFLDIAEGYIQLLKLNKRAVAAMMKQFREQFNMEPAYYSIAEFAKQLTVPGIVVHDQQDAISPFSNGEKIAANWKGSKFIATEGFGHSLNNQQLLEQIVKETTDQRRPTREFENASI